jgi:hypothetical protein
VSEIALYHEMEDMSMGSKHASMDISVRQEIQRKTAPELSVSELPRAARGAFPPVGHLLSSSAIAAV